MKTRECVKASEDCPMYRLGRHWNTIQAYLIPGIEDDIGNLGEDLMRFMQICEILINDEMFAKYRWCGNGRPPRSHASLFKAYILKAMRNYPYTTTLIAVIRESPTIRRLCGWESISDVPSGMSPSPTMRLLSPIRERDRAGLSANGVHADICRLFRSSMF